MWICREFGKFLVFQRRYALKQRRLEQVKRRFARFSGTVGKHPVFTGAPECPLDAPGTQRYLASKSPESLVSGGSLWGKDP